MKKYIKIHPLDNCLVALENIEKGYCEDNITALSDIPFGHKLSLCDIREGENIIKYGCPIGHATQDIKKGSHIHSHNLATNLSAKQNYEFTPTKRTNRPDYEPIYFNGYKRSNGAVGIRNEIWIIPTVGCANGIAQKIAADADKKHCEQCDGVYAFTHPYGCSQLGGDLRATQNIIVGLLKNGNTAGVVLVSLGCENNNLDSLMPLLDDFDKSRLRTLVCQQSEDELSLGLSLVSELAQAATTDKRVKLPISELTIGFKCGGSDAFSGITANPLCGRLCDMFTALGGKAILTEVPEMFGAETILMNRATDRKVFSHCADMINGFKDYYISHSQPVYENPSPGNRQGGITTLEEKSLGCVQKGGSAEVCDVLLYGEQCKKSGLSLLSGPGNDMVSCTNLTASGANIIIFTTGRGTPFGAPVPTVKVSTNTTIYDKKKNWIDYNAGKILDGCSFEQATNELLEYILSIADKKELTKNEQNGYREIAIFKNGVTL